jgi:hypothetical protein
MIAVQLRVQGHGGHFPLLFHGAKRNQAATSSFMVKLYTLSPADVENVVVTVTVVNGKWLLMEYLTYCHHIEVSGNRFATHERGVNVRGVN